MNCSELKNYISQYGIKAFCKNFTNMCSNICVNSNYDCECKCIDNADDDSTVAVYCDDPSYSIFHTFLMYIITIFLIITFVAFSCACVGMFRRRYRTYQQKREYNLYLGLPTYHQSQNSRQLLPPPPIYENHTNNENTLNDIPPSYENNNQNDNQHDNQHNKQIIIESPPLHHNQL